jgi:AcrR family transcriptional regulator
LSVWLQPSTMLDTMSTPSAGRIDSIRNRAQIIAAARSVFASHGPEVSLSRVVEESGLGRASVYRHFSNRFALISAIFDENLDELERQALRSRGQQRRFEAFFGLLVQQIISSGGLIALAISTAGKQSQFMSHAQRLERLLAALVDEAQEHQELESRWNIHEILLTVKILSGVVFYEPAEQLGPTVAEILTLIGLAPALPTVVRQLSGDQ